VQQGDEIRCILFTAQILSKVWNTYIKQQLIFVLQGSTSVVPKVVHRKWGLSGKTVIARPSGREISEKTGSIQGFTRCRSCFGRQSCSPLKF
jgi:hypothetical protein